MKNMKNKLNTQLISSPNQIIPKFKIGQKIQDTFGDVLVIERIYLKDGVVSYKLRMELQREDRRDFCQEKILEHIEKNEYEEDYLLYVLMARPV